MGAGHRAADALALKHERENGEECNGVIIQTEKCIGCEQDFEDVRLVGEPRPALPVCDGCAATMDPEEGAGI